MLVLMLLLGEIRLSGEESPGGASRWYRGNLHTHSLWSDGDDFPEMICDWYARNGYQYLALSDHNILSTGSKWVSEATLVKRGAEGAIERCRQRFGPDWVETREVEGKQEVRLKTLREFRGMFERPGEFILLQGEEVTDSFESLPIHINATHIDDLIRPRGGKSVREVMSNNLQAIAEHGATLGRTVLGHLNHPNYGYAVTAEDMAAVVEERFFEIYNGHPSVNQLGDPRHVSMDRMWDIANSLRIAGAKLAPLYGLATDDSHNYFAERGAITGRGWIMVRAPQLTGTRLMEAIHAGDFYASSGVELEQLTIDESAGRLSIKIRPREGATFVTEFIGTRRGVDLTGQPVLDEAGKELHATRQYSPEIGQVLARVEGLEASYGLSGDELYVRATISSSQPPDRPVYEGQKRQAWTQPIGWKKWLAAPAGSGQEKSPGLR
jgi:hypothetical protein